MRKLILLCFVFGALFFILPKTAQAILCGPDWMLFDVDMLSISVSGNELIIAGTLENGTCTQHCGTVEIPNGIWGVADPLGYLQYQIDNTSYTGWINLEYGNTFIPPGQWFQLSPASPASPICSVESTRITPAAYMFDTGLTRIPLTGTQLNPGTHVLYLRQYFDIDQNGYEGFEYSIPSAGFDFTLSPSPNSGISRMGASINSTITVTKTVGTASAVSFSAVSSPSGPTATFSPSSCTPSISTCTTTMTINPNGSSDGTYTITVSGTTGLTTRATTFTLQISNNPVDILIRQGGTTNPFSNGPITINPGTDVELQWFTSGVDSCSSYADPDNGSWIDADSVPLSGNRNIAALTGSTNFTLKCSTAYYYTGTYETEIGECSLLEQNYAFRIYNTVGDGISYRINGGVWTNLTQGSQWTQTSGFCADGCVEGVCVNIYQIDFFTPNLAVGSYTLELRYRVYDTRFKTTAYEQGPLINFTVSEYSDTVTANVNHAPDVPTLISPANGSYVNAAAPDPTFSATVTDSDIGQTIRANFEVTGFGTGNGGYVTTSGTSSWGPIAGILDDTYIWRAYAEDSPGATSSWSEYWSFTKDTVLPIVVIDQENGNSGDTNITVGLSEDDDRSGIAEGDVDVGWRLIDSPTWGAWVDTDLPNNGSTIDDFIYLGVRGYEYQFRYRAKDNAGNWSDYSTDGMVVVPFNFKPTVTNLNISIPDFCSTSPAYFFSWIYSDTDGDTEREFNIQVDDSGATFPSPEINRTYSGLSNPSPTTNNQAAIVLLNPQADYLSYNRIYNWRVRVYDINGLDSGWVNGTAFNAPTHRSPACNFTWSPISPNPGESTIFTDSSNCYDISGNSTPCTNWNWTFTDGNPATSTQQNLITQFTTSGTKDVILQVTDSFGSQCSITRQVIVSLPLPSKWKEIRPW
ncbi:MAG: PKD domain-containing protein [bacterium]|nr:PKD domain-containing protein [bacterium]